MIAMESFTDKATEKRRDIRVYLTIALASCIPVYWGCLFYIEAVTGSKTEELAFAAAVCFFGMFYTGWWLSRNWALTHPIKRGYFVVLPAIIIACIIWLFFHADVRFKAWPALSLLLFWAPFLLLSATLGALINLYRISVNNKLQEANISASNSKNELHLLQSQLSPHFLFNTLNNLYGLSITQHEKLPPLLLKLSELLRYSVYDVKELFVPLKNEVSYLNNYIEFERIRNGNRLVLSTAFEAILNEDSKIAPMLLITFIENAFKHAKNTVDEKIFIDVQVKTWNDRILFSVKNSYNPNAVDKSEVNGSSGVGLVNAKKRLVLLYPGEHDLTVEESNGFYTVLLQLKIK